MRSRVSIDLIFDLPVQRVVRLIGNGTTSRPVGSRVPLPLYWYLRDSALKYALPLRWMRALGAHLSSVGWTFLQYLEPERSWEFAPSAEPSRPPAGPRLTLLQNRDVKPVIASLVRPNTTQRYIGGCRKHARLRAVPARVDLYRKADKIFFNQYKRF